MVEAAQTEVKKYRKSME